MNLIIGGPQPTDTTGMTAVDAKLTKEADRTLRKQWSDKIRLQRLKKNKVRYPPQLLQTDCHYLIKMANNKQYAAARCAMAPDICMYGKSASSGVEAMNRVNKLVRAKSSVDPLNAAILLLQLEGDCFNKWKGIAWGTDMPLTPKGMDLMKDAFKDVNVREFKLNMQQ